VTEVALEHVAAIVKDLAAGFSITAA